MARSGDPPRVGARDEQTLQRFLASRDAGDRAGARRAWERLVEDNHDRVRAMVALWSRGGRLSREEQEDAVQRALVKVWRNMARTFAGTSMGEWVNAVRTCVGYACTDVQRAGAIRSARELTLAEPAGEEWRAADEEHRRAAERADAHDFVAWALPQVTNARRRTVLERTLDGVPAEAIAGELGVTIDNLYQLRSRGLRDLAKLKEAYDA